MPIRQVRQAVTLEITKKETNILLNGVGFVTEHLFNVGAGEPINIA